jgi:ComF family protein
MPARDTLIRLPQSKIEAARRQERPETVLVAMGAIRKRGEHSIVPESAREFRTAAPAALLRRGRTWAAQAVEWLYPSQCALCLAPARTGICAACVRDLVVNAHPCPTCAEPLPVTGACPRCQRQPSVLDAVWAPFAYAWPLSHLLLSYKSGGRSALVRPLAGLLVEHLPEAATFGVDRVVPVPLHPRRLAERGFNQAEQLARPLCRRRGLRLDLTSARRTLPTPRQQGLQRRARQTNLQDAFAVDTDLSGLRVLLVDDVMTTGATLNMLARQIRRAGAGWVGAIAVARA